MHEGTGGAPIISTNFGPITRENSREAIKILGGLVRNRCRPLGYAHRTMGVQDPLCDAAPTEISGTGDHVPQGVTKVVVSEPVSAGAAEQGSDRASSTLPGLLQPIIPCPQGNGGVEADHRSVLPQCLRALPELHYGDASVNPQGPSTGPVVNLPRSERCLLSHRDPPSRQTLPTLLSQRHLLAVHSTAIRVVNQSESIYQNTQTCTSLCPPPSGKAAHVLRRLVAKPRDSPGSSRANILAQVPVPKARVGFKPREVGANPFSGFHVSGDRAGHLCRPSKAVTQEVDQLAIRSGGIHGTAVTTCCPVAPSTWTPSLSRETSALWSNSYSSHSMAIETPVEPVEGEILKTDPTRPSVPPGYPMVDQQGQCTKGSPIREHRCGVLPVYRQQYSGLGCPSAGSNCIWHLVPGPVPITHQCPGASSHMAWPKSFQPKSGECEGCSHVRQHVSGCLPEKSGGHQIARNERFSHGHMSVVREEGNMTLVPRYLPGHLNVLADHLSRRGQILKTEWSLNQTIADRIFRAWGRPFVNLFALGKNTKLAIYFSPIRDETSWKVDSLVQSWDGLYAYAYPPTSLIRACLNKVRTENVEIVLIAPVWPNQEWFPDLLGLSIDFPIIIPPVQKLLKQTFSHHFHPHPWNLNLHAWRLSRHSTRREEIHI